MDKQKGLHNIKIFQKKITFKDSSEVFGSGIDEESIENPGELEEALKSYVCVICLEIVKIPMECRMCESVYCSDCWDLLKTQGKKCTIGCDPKHVEKASQFVNDVLSNLNVKCLTCGCKTDYLTFIKHQDACSINQKFFNREEFKKILVDQDLKIESLEKELEEMKSKRNEKKKQEEKQQKENKHEKLLNDPEVKKIREELLVNNLTNEQKKEFQKIVTEGKYQEFVDLVLGKNYNILEEISPKNYYWTALHYAMYYGHKEIITFCMSMLESNQQLEKAMSIFSSDGRCPILCFLTNSMNLDQKRSFLAEILSQFPKLKVSTIGQIEMKKRGLDNLLKIYAR